MATDEEFEDLQDAVDIGWILVCTALVFWEQAGFAMLEAGSVRARNLSNILLKNLMDVSLGALVFAAVGYGLAFGKSAGSGFVGSSGFFLASLSSPYDYAMWAWHWSFAATAATTVSGCVAERIDCVAYLVCATLVTGVVYAVPVHWVWSDDGAFSVWNRSTALSTGAIDFAGSGLVHMVGGVAGLVGSVLLGPRLGRFPAAKFEGSLASRCAVAARGRAALSKKNLPKGVVCFDDLRSFRGHNVTLTALGVYCLWFGWFGFNAGCSGGLSRGGAKVAALAAVNTALAPPCGAVAAVACAKWRTGHWSLPATISGLLAGLVGITGPCGVVGPGSAAAVGFGSGLVYFAAREGLDACCVDDPVEAIAIHAFPGAWGVLASGLFARASRLDAAGYDHARPGLFVGGGGGQLAVQAAAVLAIAAWTLVASAAAFLVGDAATRACGNASGLRVDANTELRGLDLAKHGGSGLRFFAADVSAMLGVGDEEAPNAADHARALCTELATLARDAPLPLDAAADADDDDDHAARV